MTAAEGHDKPHPNKHSVSFEQMLQHRFLADLTAEMWFGRGQLVDVLTSAVDAFGYDLVLQTRDVVRHVQLKTKRHGAKTADQNIGVQLSERPAGCVVVLQWRETSQPPWIDVEYRWFGSGPHQSLPPLGDKMVRHTKGDSTGVKKLRPGLRSVRMSRFDEVHTMSELCDLLFGASEQPLGGATS